MSVEQKIDFLSLLKRRKDNLRSWLLKTKIKSYDDFCKILDGMNASRIEQNVFDNLIKELCPEPLNVVEIPVIVEEVLEEKSEELQKELEPPKKYGRRKKEIDVG